MVSHVSLLEMGTLARRNILPWRALWLFNIFLLWNTIEGQIRYTIPEELKERSVVGNIAKDLGLGVTEISDRKLRIASEAGKQYFNVDMEKGELVVNEKIDREILCGKSANCLLPLQLVIEGPLQLFRVEVEIQDINDNSPRFPTDERTLKIAESTVFGSRFPLESAQDPDVGSNSLKSYILNKDECFSLKVKHFDDGRKVPELILNKSLDREKQAVHDLLLTAIDGGDPPRSSTSRITVIVLDNNDNIPQFEKTLYKITVSEDSPVGTSLIQLKASDLDEGLNGEIHYSFADRASDSLTSMFEINAKSGELFLKGNLDYENTAMYRMDISAKDKGSPEMEGHCSVQVEIIDVNDNPPEIILTSQSSQVREDAPGGSVVALISAQDLDSGDSGKVILHVSPDYPFMLKPSFADHYALVTNGILDREQFPEYNIEITATDCGSPSHSSKKTITVNILDVNDNPPSFSDPSYKVYLTENNKQGAILCAVFASDPDFEDNAKISYSILDSKVHNVAMSSNFYINSENGSIYTMHSFDYEKEKVFQIQVQAKDHGSPSLSSNATVHVFILDENDNTPTVIYPSAVMGTVSNQNIPRSAKAGHLATKVTAVDADSGHNAWISYRLVEATDASLFSVNLYTGEVRTRRTVSEQDDSSQRLLIEIRDNGEPVRSSTVTVGISLEDGVHEPLLNFRPKAQGAVNKSSNITFYLIISLVSVSAMAALTFVILAVKCIRNNRRSACCCTKGVGTDGYENPNRNLQIQLNTDGPIKYVEVLGGDMLSQSQSFRSCLSPMSEFSDFTFVKPSSTTDFKEMINVLDASLPDSAWTFESQQVSISSSLLKERNGALFVSVVLWFCCI